jgi:hypothetical protein
MHGCIRVNTARGAGWVAANTAEADASLAYARLRLDLLRLARQVGGTERAATIVQDVLRHVVRSGPKAPRDARGFPRPAYLASLVQAFAAADGAPAPGELAGGETADLFAVMTACSAASAAGARGG